MVVISSPHVRTSDEIVGASSASLRLCSGLSCSVLNYLADLAAGVVALCSLPIAFSAWERRTS